MHPLRLTGLWLSPWLLACAGLVPAPDRPSPPTDAPARDDAPPEDGDEERDDDALVPPQGPWVLELADEGDGCRWQLRGRTGAPTVLGAHPGGCPTSWSLGVDDAGLPTVAINDRGQVVVREGGQLGIVPSPPAGDPARAAVIDGQVVVDTLVTGPFDKPLTYGDRTYSTTEIEGLPAFAVRWRRQADGAWQEQQVVETTTGWDHAPDVDALQPPLPELPIPGSAFRSRASDVDDLGAVEVPPRDGQEGWLVADGPHGPIVSGFFYGEGIRACAPVAVEHDGNVTVLELSEGLSQLSLHFDDHYLAVGEPWEGGGQLVDLATGQVVLTSEHRMIWLGAE